MSRDLRDFDMDFLKQHVHLHLMQSNRIVMCGLWSAWLLRIPVRIGLSSRWYSNLFTLIVLVGLSEMMLKGETLLLFCCFLYWNNVYFYIVSLVTGNNMNSHIIIAILY